MIPLLIKVDNKLELSGKHETISYLTMLIEEVNNMILDEHEQKMYKQELAKLRKEKQATKQKINSYKEELLQPLYELEEELQEVQSLIDTLENSIDKKVKEFDDSRRFNKYNELQEIFLKYRDHSYNIPFIEFDQWIENHHLNKGMSISKCTIEIVRFFERVKDDLVILNTLSEKERIRPIYEKSLNLGYAIKTIADLDAPKRLNDDLEKEFTNNESLEKWFKIRLSKDHKKHIEYFKNNNIYFFEI